MISQLKLQQHIEALLHDKHALDAFRASAENARKELNSWGLNTGLKGAESCTVGIDEFQRLLSQLEHEFAVHVAFAYIYAGSGSITPRPGGPHLERLEAGLQADVLMTTHGMLSTL